MRRPAPLLASFVFVLVYLPTCGTFIATSAGLSLLTSSPSPAWEPTIVFLRTFHARRERPSRASWGLHAVCAKTSEEARSTRDYNLLLQQCARERNYKKAGEVLSEMDSVGIAWDIYTFNAALNCFCHPTTQKFEHYPVELMTEMRRKRISPNVITLNTALKRDLDGALGFVEQMQVTCTCLCVENDSGPAAGAR
eukprot:768330-Hanusia_phi.AAC.6